MFDDGSYRRRKRRYKRRSQDTDRDNEEDTEKVPSPTPEHEQISCGGGIDTLVSVATGIAAVGPAIQFAGTSGHTSPGFMQPGAMLSPNAPHYPHAQRPFDTTQHFSFIPPAVNFPHRSSETADIPVSVTSPLIMAYAQQQIPNTSSEHAFQDGGIQTTMQHTQQTSGIMPSDSHYSPLHLQSTQSHTDPQQWSPPIQQLPDMTTITACTGAPADSIFVQTATTAATMPGNISECSSDSGGSPHHSSSGALCPFSSADTMSSEPSHDISLTFGECLESELNIPPIQADLDQEFDQPNKRTI